MNQKQLQAATQSMINWLADEHELGKAPYKIECTGTFEYEGLRFYMFKYKVSLFGKWLLGVAGGFEGDDLEPCGHTFSEQNLYHESTAQADCIAMVDMIMEYYLSTSVRSFSVYRSFSCFLNAFTIASLRS